MAEAEKRTITIKTVNGEPWPKPNSEQLWHSVTIEEYPSEPMKFVQDKAKNAPAPEVGSKYTGNVYVDGGKMKFYPFTPKPQAPAYGGYQKDDKEIRAQAMLKSAVEYAGRIGWLLDPNEQENQVEALDALAKHLYDMVDTLKGSESPKEPTKEAPIEISDKPITMSDIPF